MLQIPFISTIVGLHSDLSVSNALSRGRRSGSREREKNITVLKNFLLIDATLLMKLSGVSFSLSLKIVVLVSSLSCLALFYASLKWAGLCSGGMMINPLALPLSSSFSNSEPPSLSIFVLSVNVLDGGLSPGKYYYTHFLCNVNDGDPLFISDLLIISQPIAYPPRQGSHSHSRHYFIKRARLLRAFINNTTLMQVWCVQRRGSSGEPSESELDGSVS